MGDAGEGLIDADSRIQERLEDLEREREERRNPTAVKNPERARELESLRLARVELERQFEATTNERRRSMLTQALADLDKRIAAARAKPE